MSLKAELEIWAAALKAYDEDKFDVAMEEFDKIADTSKICWNIGIILATLGKHDDAVARFDQATKMDMYFTVAYQQKGVSNFMLGRYEAAHKDFEDALLYLRGNQTINYEQLGLDFKLFSAEVLFNCGLAKIYLGQTDDGMADLREAQAQKQVDEHAVIDDAIQHQGRDYNVFSVPVGVLFKPPAIKLKNLAARDYMGKAVLVAATDVNDAYTTFTGITRLQRGQTPTGAPLDPSHPMSRSASVSAIPTVNNATPIANRLARSNTLASTRLTPIDTKVSSNNKPLSAAPNVTVSRSLTTVRPTLAPLQTNQLGAPYSATAPLAVNRSTGSRSNGRLFYPPGGQDNREDRVSPILRTPPNQPSQPLHASKQTLRVTELYDDYYKSSRAYDDEIPPELPPIGGAKKREQMEAWSRKTQPGLSLVDRDVSPLNRSASTASRFGTPPPTSFGNRSLQRMPSRAGSQGLRVTSRYEDEDISEAGSGFYDMNKIRVKVHVGTLTRGMSVLPEQNYNDFVQMLRQKFSELGDTLMVRFKDEDGDMLSMQDEGDFEAAVDVARVMAKGRSEGKLEIWVD